MKKNILLLAISILLTVNCFSQSPNYLWASRAGVNGSTANGIAADISGNVIVTGTFIGPNILFGTTTLTNAGSGSSTDIFIVKYDPNGNVLWAKKQTAGGTAYDVAKGVAVDANGNVIVTGNFDSPSITFGTTTLTNAGANDIFTVKYDPNGNVLWAKKQGAGGSANNDVPYRVTADASGNVFVTGNFQSPTITFGTTTLTNTTGTSATDIFIVKYDPNGNVLWAKQQDADGSANELGAGVAADASGNVIVTGWFNSPTVTFGTTTLTNTQSPNSIDIFIVKYDSNGNVLWAKQQDAGGTGDDNAVNVAADASGNVIVTGWFNSPTITFGTTTLTNAGSSSRDIFIVKYDPNGNVLWAKQQDAGATDDDVANSVAADANGNVLVSGRFISSTITFGTTTLTNAGSSTGDIFIAKYDPSGNVLWAKQQDAGGTGADVANSVAADTSGNVIAAGTYTAQANPPINITFGTTTLGMPPGNPVPTPVNIFVVKLQGTATVLAQPPTFGCDTTTAYLFQGNPTNMYGLNLNTGISQLLASPLIANPPNQYLNAFGYNRVDNYIWGYRINTNQLIRVASDYSVNTFTIAGLPSNKVFNVADISENGIMYLYLQYDTTIYRIDLNPVGNPQLILPNLAITSTFIADWAFSPIDGNIYSINSSTWNIYRFDTAGVRTDLGIANGGGIQGAPNFGAIFMDSLGNMYAVNNNTGKIFKIVQPNTGNITATFYSQGATSTNNDGAANSTIGNIPLITVSNDSVICKNTSIQLNASSSSGNIVWQTDSTLTCTACSNPIASPVNPTTYFVTANDHGCISKDSVSVSFSDSSLCAGEIIQDTLVMPNVFTPGNDGFNDIFNPIKNEGMIISKIEIFNRWGQLIHEEIFPEILWDGNTNNVNSTDGVYYWIVKYKNSKGIEKASNGFLHLIR